MADVADLDEWRKNFDFDAQLEVVLDRKLADPSSAGRIAGFAAAYIRDRLRENKECTVVMLRRIQRVLEACEKHLEDK